jgi:hypothetical protein
MLHDRSSRNTVIEPRMESVPNTKGTANATTNSAARTP